MLRAQGIWKAIKSRNASLLRLFPISLCCCDLFEADQWRQQTTLCIRVFTGKAGTVEGYLPSLNLSSVLHSQLSKWSSILEKKKITFTTDRSLFWSDSMVVLQFITGKTLCFHKFVTNYIGTIHQASDPDQWQHIKSDNNPATDAIQGLRSF